MHSALSVFNTPTAEHGSIDHAPQSSSSSSSIKATHVIKPSDLAAAAAAAAQQHHQHQQQHQHHGSGSSGSSGSGVAVLMRANTTAGVCPSVKTTVAGNGGGVGNKTPLTVTASVDASDSLYDTVDNVKPKYSYHDEPHSFESSMEFLEDFNHFPCEVLETTV